MREKVFSELCSAQEQFISGNQIADKLGISRVAVWKHITALKKMGYQIEAVRNKGYLLHNKEKFLSTGQVFEYLHTGFVGQNLIYYPATVSTNQTLKELLSKKKLTEGSVVVSQKQSQGRGRQGKEWESPDGGLWFSVFLKPHLAVQQTALLSLVMATALARALSELISIPLTIKWPNDVFCSGKKISGILLELRGEMEKIEYLICGIGINVNIAAEAFSADLIARATSFYIEKGTYFSLAQVLGTVLNYVEQYYQKFLAEGISDILDEFKLRCLHLGKPVSIEVAGDWIEGINTDIDMLGNLKIQTVNGIRSVSTGDLQVL